MCALMSQLAKILSNNIKCMTKEKFIYNKQTLRYEKIVEPIRIKIFRVLGFFCAVVVAAFILISIAFTYFPSPKEKVLQRELSQMKDKYSLLNQEMVNMEKVISNIQERDANVHRLMFGMEPVDESLWRGGVGGHDPFGDITNFESSGDLLKQTQERMDMLKRQLAVQSTSLDTITSLAMDREKMLASIPSVKPVRSDKLKRNIRLLSGFGRRIDPFTKVGRMHKGIDFTAPLGTPIYATGDGKIVEVTYKRTGYGYHVVIDHGYGYKTLYAHMSKIEVKKGQAVKKGQQIGLVGSTGRSTAPHLHYEVRLNGKAINPMHYCLDKLTPEEYQILVEMAETPNQSFD